jgi:DNA-binding transcriptional LysR family regulator
VKIEYLREFVILAEYLNFTQAAEHLFITQPVLSRHINALETELGATILHRSTQNVKLTEVGSFFLERVRSILSEYDGLIREVRLKDQGYDTVLRIGIPYYSTNYYLGQVPRWFIEAYPRIKLTYLTDHPDHIIEALKKDEVDLLIAAHMPFRYAEDFTFHDVFVEPLNVLFPGNHRLAERPNVTIADLSGESFLGVETNYFNCTWSYIKNLCRQNGFEPKEPVKYNQLESVVIAIGQGAGIIIEGQNLKSLPQVDLATVPLVGEGCSRLVSLIYKEGNKNPSVQKFIRIYDKHRNAHVDSECICDSDWLNDADS